MESEILEFLARRFTSDCKWTDGNCLWMANILSLRFPLLKIYYFPHQGHFVSGTGSEFYDWTGRVEPLDKETPILFEDIRRKDPLWYERLVRDCWK